MRNLLQMWFDITPRVNNFLVALKNFQIMNLLLCQSENSVFMTALFLSQWMMVLLSGTDVSVNESIPTPGGLHTL